jgi:hypothetical protein
MFIQITVRPSIRYGAAFRPLHNRIVLSKQTAAIFSVRAVRRKKRVSLNNLRHGLTWQTTVLSPEDRAAHDKFRAGLLY